MGRAVAPDAPDHHRHRILGRSRDRHVRVIEHHVRFLDPAPPDFDRLLTPRPRRQAFLAGLEDDVPTQGTLGAAVVPAPAVGAREAPVAAAGAAGCGAGRLPMSDGGPVGRNRSGVEEPSRRASVRASKPGIKRSENPARKHQTTSSEKNFNQATASTSGGSSVAVDDAVGGTAGAGADMPIDACAPGDAGAEGAAAGWAEVTALKSGNAAPVTIPETKKK